MKHVYPSAVDWWLALLLIAIPALPIGIGVAALGASTASGVGLIAIGGVLGVAIALLSIPCRYILSDESLDIRCGLRRESVPLGKVVEAKRSSSCWSAPALSLRRVEVFLTDGSRVISPRDRDAFMVDIRSRAARARKATAGTEESRL